MKIVRAIRNGWIKPKKDEKADKPRYYLIWDKEDDQVCTCTNNGMRALHELGTRRVVPPYFQKLST